MEKSIRPVDIVIKAQDEGSISFEIKEPQKFNRELYSDLKKEISLHNKGAIVIYPDQKVIDSQRVIIRTKTSLL